MLTLLSQRWCKPSQKGKVSAEELSGQLGERLPGAVTKFAEANDMTLPQLQESI